MDSPIQNQDFLYFAAPFFMVRTPVLSFDNFFLLRDSKNINETILSLYEKNSTIQESIAIASPTLHNILKTGKKEKAQLSSMLKYLLRMSTRSTPFGLFAFVSLGSWNESTNMEINLRDVKKRARPDMQWLFNLIDRITAQPDLFPELYVRKNPLIFKVGDRVFLNHVRNNEEEKEKKTCSIKSNYLIDTIFELVETKIRIEELENKIIEEHPSLSREKIPGVIKTLLAQGFLLYDLLPSLLSETPFEEFVHKLTTMSSFDSTSIKDISYDIQKYNQTSLGSGEKLLDAIQENMKNLTTSSYYLQVDSSLKSHQLHLNKKIAEDLQEVAEILWKLTPESESPLQSYFNKFLDKYGTERLIPIKELINEESGLGIPEQYKNPFQAIQKKDSKKNKWQRWLKNEWINCLNERKKEIILSEEIVKKVTEKSNQEKAPLSFDLFFELIADSSKHIDQGNYYLQITNSITYGGSTFGRFVDILGDKAKENLKNLFDGEEALQKNCLFAESSYLPFSPRSANVAIHPNLRQYFIDLSSSDHAKGSIQLEDIYVGATSNRLYLFSKKENKELIIKVGNVLNPSVAPAILQLLRAISMAEYNHLNSFLWSDFENVPFLPRLTLKKTILSAAQWKITLERLGATKNDAPEAIVSKFKSWAAKWYLPSLVFMTVVDNRILLDWNHPSHLDEIVTRLKKDEEVILVEKIENENGVWVKDEIDEKHFSEFVVSFVKNKQYIPSRMPLKTVLPTAIAVKDRLKLPGSEWLYVKFYVCKENEFRVLANHVTPFAEFFKDKKMINEWFFIHYGDPDTHLRVRFRGEKEKIVTQFLPQLHDWASSLIQMNQIQNVQICCYDREIERYGGVEVIDMAESFFCSDSTVAIALNQLISNKKTKLPPHAVAALSLINLLHECGLDLKDQIDFFSRNSLDRKELEGFREWKKELLKHTDTMFKGHYRENDEIKFLHEIWLKRKDAIRHYTEKMQILDKEKKLSSTIAEIQNSLLHMHCNRIMKTDLKMEAKARLYAFHTLESLLAEKKSKIEKAIESENS